MKVKRLSDVSKFTLIELLITIAIIAILAALLLPALNSAKAKGQAIACGGNLRSCGIALQQYTGDNQDCMPYSPAIYMIRHHSVTRRHGNANWGTIWDGQARWADRFFTVRRVRL